MALDKITADLFDRDSVRTARISWDTTNAFDAAHYNADGFASQYGLEQGLADTYLCDFGGVAHTFREQGHHISLDLSKHGAYHMTITRRGYAKRAFKHLREAFVKENKAKVRNRNAQVNILQLYLMLERQYAIR